MLWVKSTRLRGGYARNVFIDRFRGAGFRSAVIAMTMRYDDRTGEFPPAFSTFQLSNLDVSSATYALDLDGLAESLIGPIAIADSRFAGMEDALRIRHAAPIEWRNVSVNGRAMISAAAAPGS